MKKTNDYFESVPNVITSKYIMEKPNQSIDIFKGEYSLKIKDRTLTIKGKIFFSWLPAQNVKFEGVVKEPKFNSIVEIVKQGFYSEIDLYINDYMLGKAQLLNYKHIQETNLRIEIGGIINSESVLGDKSISVSKVVFIIPNLTDLLGDPVKFKNDDDKGGPTYLGRSIFENDKYIITIDKLPNYKSLYDDLKKQGGYITLYTGEIIKKKGDIDFKELQELRHSFSVFLSFLNGRQCSPLFLQGVHENETKWTDFTAYRTEPFKTVESWLPKSSTNGLNELWYSFSDLWRNKSDKDFLEFIIYWYLEANGNSAKIEGSIIIAQVALELIYNWLIIEKKKLLIGKDGENISAANKIRLLLSQVKLDVDTPNVLINLKKFINDNDEIADGVDAFVSIRNALVHSQVEKRKKLTKISSGVKFEALQLSIKYIEHSLLSILNYKGKYYDRCSGKLFEGEGVEK